jgi:hypothetical protein
MEDRAHRPQTASAFSPARQVDSVHDPRKSKVGKYHGDVASANQHGRQGCFGGFTFNGLKLVAFEQCYRESAQFNIILASGRPTGLGSRGQAHQHF